jgi:hypothetical protein
MIYKPPGDVADSSSGVGLAPDFFNVSLRIGVVFVGSRSSGGEVRGSGFEDAGRGKNGEKKPPLPFRVRGPK